MMLILVLITFSFLGRKVGEDEILVLTGFGAGDSSKDFQVFTEGKVNAIPGMQKVKVIDSIPVENNYFLETEVMDTEMKETKLLIKGTYVSKISKSPMTLDLVVKKYQDISAYDLKQNSRSIVELSIRNVLQLKMLEDIADNESQLRTKIETFVRDGLKRAGFELMNFQIEEFFDQYGELDILRTSRRIKNGFQDLNVNRETMVDTMISMVMEDHSFNGDDSSKFYGVVAHKIGLHLFQKGLYDLCIICYEAAMKLDNENNAYLLAIEAVKKKLEEVRS